MLVDGMAHVSEQDQDGLTALMNAAEIGAGEIVTYLLNKGSVCRQAGNGTEEEVALAV